MSFLKNFVKMVRESHNSVKCKPRVLFEILSGDLDGDVCCYIEFTYNGVKHKFGAYEEYDEKKRNTKFFLDKDYWSTIDEFRENAKIEDKLLFWMDNPVTVTFCDFRYPKNDKRLKVSSRCYFLYG